MKKTYIKIFSFILCLVMLLGVSALVVAAEKEEYEPVKWKLDPNLTYLYGENKRYDRYLVKGAFYGDAVCKFYFMNEPLYEGRSCTIYGESAYPHIVSVSTEAGYSCIFVDAEGKAILDAFLDGSDLSYYLEDFDVTYTKIDKDTVDFLDKSYTYKKDELIWVDVRDLEYAQIYEITAHDKTETKAYQHGAVYVMPDGTYYYVCFKGLDNSYFDADGYFSYRSGTVPAYELSDKYRKDIDTAIAAMMPKVHNEIYEAYVVEGYYDIYGNYTGHDAYDDYYDSLDPNYKLGAIICFFVITIFVGILMPAALLAIGIVLSNVKATGKAKCWYALSAVSALWILSAALFLLLVLI